MNPLSDADQDLLGRYRQATRHADPRVEASLARVRDRVAAGETHPVAEELGRTGTGLGLKVGAFVAIGALVGAALALGSEGDGPSSTATAMSTVDAGSLARPGRAPDAGPPTEAPVDTIAPAPARAAPPPSPGTDRPAAPVETKGSALRRTRAGAVEKTPVQAESKAEVDEIQLMVRARRALRKGNAADALVHLGEHARRFPRGQMRRDREASRVMALCALGRESEAAAVAVELGDPAPGLVEGNWAGCPAR